MIDRMRNQQAFEQARADILASLKPTDWVSKYLIQNKKNPFKDELANPKQTVDEMMSALKDKENFLKSF